MKSRHIRKAEEKSQPQFLLVLHKIVMLSFNIASSFALRYIRCRLSYRASRQRHTNMSSGWTQWLECIRRGMGISWSGWIFFVMQAEQTKPQTWRKKTISETFYIQHWTTLTWLMRQSPENRNHWNLSFIMFSMSALHCFIIYHSIWTSLPSEELFKQLVPIHRCLMDIL